jgi:hypothetical protein
MRRQTRDMSSKDLTASNWLEPDPTSQLFARFTPEQGLTPMDGQSWASDFLGVELGHHVPESVRELFAAARGTMVYGWFFYPLFKVGEEQLYRVLDAAIRERYRQLQGPHSRPRLFDAIDWLLEHEVIPSAERERWNALRKLRNMASHPDFQSVAPPGHAMHMLRATARDIDLLFGGSTASPQPG